MRIINRKDNKALIYYNNNFYMVSEANNQFTGYEAETLIFKSAPDGTVEDYIEVGGGKGLTLDEVLNNIDEHLYSWEG
jgi:hypothetical protein